jgi:hypothetical protein
MHEPTDRRTEERRNGEIQEINLLVIDNLQYAMQQWSKSSNSDVADESYGLRRQRRYAFYAQFFRK